MGTGRSRRDHRPAEFRDGDRQPSRVPWPAVGSHTDDLTPRGHVIDINFIVVCRWLY